MQTFLCFCLQDHGVRAATKTVIYPPQSLAHPYPAPGAYPSPVNLSYPNPYVPQPMLPVCPIVGAAPLANPYRLRFGNPYENEAGMRGSTTVAIRPDGTWFGNPYKNEVEGAHGGPEGAEGSITVPPGNSSMLYLHPCLPQQEGSDDDDDDNGGDVVAKMDPLVNGASPVVLEPPLTPLPAPLQPEVLPSAKVARVKAVNDSE